MASWEPSEERIRRYSRQLILPGFGWRTQQRLAATSVVLAGDPWARAATSWYLAGAGLGGVQGVEGTVVPRSLGWDHLAGLNPDLVRDLPGGAEAPVELWAAAPPVPLPGSLDVPARLVLGALAACQFLVGVARGAPLARQSPAPDLLHWAVPPGGPPSGGAAVAGATVVVVGVGGLGGAAALGLALGGVGTLHLVDGEAVDLSHLPRQVLYRVTDTGRPKVEVAAGRLGDAAPAVRVRTSHTRLTPDNADELLGGASLAVDGSDTWSTHFLLNDTCRLRGIPVVSGTAFRTEAQVQSVAPGDAACYRCTHPEAPAAEAAASSLREGILGPVAGAAGFLQAVEAIKLLTGAGRPLLDATWLYSAWDGFMGVAARGRLPGCPGCASGPFQRGVRTTRS